jgi:hypothetical protein
LYLKMQPQILTMLNELWKFRYFEICTVFSEIRSDRDRIRLYFTKATIY